MASNTTPTVELANSRRQSLKNAGRLVGHANSFVEQVKKSSRRTKVQQRAHRASVEALIFTLFDRLDINDSGRLSTKEIVFGLHLAGLIVDVDVILAALQKVEAGEELLPDQFFLFIETIAGTDDLTALEHLLDAVLSGFRSGSLQKALEEVSRESTVAVNEALHDAETATTGEVQLSVSTKDSFLDSQFEEEKSCKSALFEFFFVGKMFYFTCVCAWIFTHVCILCFVNGWTFGRGVYYSIQSGLSIGFGSLNEDKLTGSDMWGQCSSLPNISSLITSVYAQYPGGMLPPGHDGTLCVSYSEANPYAEVSKFYTVVHLYLGATIIGGILGLFASLAIEKSESWYKEVEETVANVNVDVGGGKKKCTMFYDRNASVIRAWGFLALWLTVGTLYGVLKEKWTFVTSLYFASAACSTGGLAGPTPDPAGVWFTAVYSIIGVPLYGAAVGQIAEGLTKRYIQKQQQKTMAKAIDQAEFDIATRLKSGAVGSGDGTIDLFSFTLMQLYRLRRTNEEEIKEIWDDFRELDADKNGKFTRSEMQAAMAFDSKDIDHSSNLTLAEVTDLIRDLQHTPCLEFGVASGLMMLDPSKVYLKEEIKNVMMKFNDTTNDAPSAAGKVLLERGEFMKFWATDFEEYKHQKKSALSTPMVELKVLLKALKLKVEKEAAAAAAKKVPTATI